MGHGFATAPEDGVAVILDLWLVVAAMCFDFFPRFARRLARHGALALMLGVASAAWAEPDDGSDATRRPQNRAPDTNAKGAVGDDEATGPSLLDNVPTLSALARLRDSLADKGVRVRGLYLGDPYGDLSGGIRRGAAYSGRLDVQIDVDTTKVLGLGDVTLHANIFQIHGRDLSQKAIGNLLSINDIASLPTTRLYELWVEKQFGDSVSIRAGQIGIDVEFLTSDYAATFVNATFGWPGLPTFDLPEGGPAYPLATPAVRIKLDPTPQISVLAAIFDGEPAGPGAGDPQARDRYGLNFRVKDPPLVFTEARYRYNQGGAVDALPGTVKLGAFAHFGRFDDLRQGTDGLPLAASGSNGIPVSHSPDLGFYGILDQLIYRPEGAEPQNGIGLFARAIGAPGGQNLVDLYLDTGFNAIGLVPGRPADVFGAAVAYANIGQAARGYDQDLNAATGLGAPVRDFEAVLELTYVAQIVPGLNLQPDLQYIVHPGGHVSNPLGNGLTPIHDALVLGVTTQLRF